MIDLKSPPNQLPNNTLTEWCGDYYYRDIDGILWMFRVTQKHNYPIEVIKLEYPPRNGTIKGDPNKNE